MPTTACEALREEESRQEEPKQQEKWKYRQHQVSRVKEGMLARHVEPRQSRRHRALPPAQPPALAVRRLSSHGRLVLRGPNGHAPQVIPHAGAVPRNRTQSRVQK